MSGFVSSLASSVETQGLNSLVGGFSFASALAWYGLVQAIIEKYVKQGPGIQAHLLAALLTTLLSILVFMLIKNFYRPDLKEPQQAVFAVTR
jgi:uncharacterized membrane protein YwzB